ncbi:SRPBCC family protein [Nocardia nova]|uniref:SRPBCC family protein n=1 Tax=Nocardia nova TaxID=37330 RepID=UPI0034078F1E
MKQKAVISEAVGRTEPTPDGYTASATVHIDAPADVVYDIVSNVIRYPEWVAETIRCTWRGTDTAPRAGARFKGTNKYRWRRWTTKCMVTTAEQGRHFEFSVDPVLIAKLWRREPFALWGYRIVPTESGTEVTEYTRRLEPRLATLWMNRILLGIGDRDVHNQHNIDKSVVSLKTYAESRAAV